MQPVASQWQHSKLGQSMQPVELGLPETEKPPTTLRSDLPPNEMSLLYFLKCAGLSKIPYFCTPVHPPHLHTPATWTSCKRLLKCF
eukprot:SAG25_NODE_37_length_19691_cov_19.319467_11_plen_86_part_00